LASMPGKLYDAYVVQLVAPFTILHDDYVV
jgi:hypothetical protein